MDFWAPPFWIRSNYLGYAFIGAQKQKYLQKNNAYKLIALSPIGANELTYMKRGMLGPVHLTPLDLCIQRNICTECEGHAGRIVPCKSALHAQHRAVSISTLFHKHLSKAHIPPPNQAVWCNMSVAGPSKRAQGSRLALQHYRKHDRGSHDWRGHSPSAKTLPMQSLTHGL